MRSRRNVENPAWLLDDVSDALRSLPGARALYTFGSLADGDGDNYSDLDLRLLTGDVHLSLASRYAVLGRVRPIALEWTIERTDDNWAATILFDGVSPYHKLDIDISVIGSGIPADQPGFVRLWQADAQTADTPPAFTQSNAPYSPARGSVQHFVLGHLLGVTRYLKVRRRGHVFTSWRFASALIDAMLALRYMRAFPGERIDRKLTTGEYLKLDRATDAAAHERFFDRLNLSSPEAMDTSMHGVALKVIALGAELTRDAPIPSSLIAQLTDFFDAELRRV